MPAQNSGRAGSSILSLVSPSASLSPPNSRERANEFRTACEQNINSRRSPPTPRVAPPRAVSEC
jgi:hypothetical protein